MRTLPFHEAHNGMRLAKGKTMKYLGMTLGTKVLNPMRRGGAGFSQCFGCKRHYTQLGLTRHWPKCEKLTPRPGGGYVAK